ncbi:transcription-repair-coupling factor [Gossypium hirsutum]|uniref:Transcription-repair-coupling factor n=1 Tax=Gossypium hirsutum TaxID=3635 RepID=A0A1U8INV2_GOSHI|nr:transcription-repair-coupling factor-like [Gossypium hirsutum]
MPPAMPPLKLPFLCSSPPTLPPLPPLFLLIRRPRVVVSVRAMLTATPFSPPATSSPSALTATPIPRDRFGVKQKEKIASFKTSVDVLTLSATPIPRTLYLALTGFRDAKDDEDDSVAKMKAAEEALEAKQKVTNSLSATCSFFFIMFYNFVTNCSWYSENFCAKLPYDSIVFILHGCTMYFLTSLINFMCGV